MAGGLDDDDAAPAWAAPTASRADPTDDTCLADTQASVDPPASVGSAFTTAGTPFATREVLGRGGMGQVVLADDLRLGRPVAIKSLLRDSAGARARFEREVRLAARLQHPNIVPVYQAGQNQRGEPFYAMRPVTGQTLAEAIRGAGDRAARLALVPRVIAVADALGFAHRHRIIHRDLKPANVLIGEHGETVVIDWGLAKELGARAAGGAGDAADASDADVTRDGSVVGTPAYMAPEQARGEEVDARADVYAIGAILYHVLAGQAPYHDAADVEALLAAVRAGPPRPLAALAPEVPHDLIAIAERAMARAPADRYADAGALAEDLTRFTTGRLVSAHAYGLRELLGRWLRRNRRVVAIAAVAAVALAVIGGYSVQAIRRERTVAQRERAVAQRERGAADERRQDVEGLLDFMLGDLYARLERSGDLDALAASTDRIAAYFARHPVATGDGAGAERRARLDLQLAGVALARGDLARAEELAIAAVALVDGLGAPGDRGPLLDDALDTLADLQVRRGRLAPALATVTRGMALADGRAAGDPPWQRRAAGWRFVRARIRAAQGDPAAARRDLEDALAGYRAVVTATRGDPVAERDVARTLSKLAALAGEARDDRGALAHAEEAAAVFERLAAAEPDRLLPRADLVHALSARGRYQSAVGDVAGARTSFERAQALAERLVVEDPGRIDHQQALALILTELAKLARDRREFPAALALGRRGLALVEHLAQVDPAHRKWRQNVAEAHDQLAATLRESGDLAAALAEYAPAMAVRRALIAEAPDALDDVFELARDHDKASMLERDLGRHADAARTSLAAAALRAPILASHPDNREAHFQQAITLMRVGSERVDSGDRPGAVAAYLRGVEVIDGLVARGAADAQLAELRALLLDLRAACCARVAAGGPPLP